MLRALRGSWAIFAVPPSPHSVAKYVPETSEVYRGKCVNPHGSCLAIGYSQWAALLEVPVERIEVEVESNFDARGSFGIEDQPPGFTCLRYRVTVESPAPEADVQEVIDEADAHSPVLDDFRRPLPVDRELQIITPPTRDEES